MNRLRHRSLVAIAFVAMGSGVLVTPALADGVLAAATEIGVTAESLTIAGFDAQNGSTILARIDDAQELRTALAAQRQLAADAGAVVTGLLELLDGSPTDEALLGQYEAAVHDLDTAKAAIQQLRQSLFETAMDGMPAEKVERVVIWREAARNRVSPQFRVRLRTPEQWRSIELALRAELRATRLGQPLAEEPAQLLAEVRSDPLVVQAAYDLQVNLVEMEAVFAQP